MLKQSASFLAGTAVALTFTASHAMSDSDQAKQQPHEVKLINPAEQRVIPFPGHATIPMITGDDTEGGVSFMRFELPPRTFGAPPHIHANEDEYAYVISGEVRILTDNGVVSATEGMMATLPRGELHGFWNASDDPLILLFGISPSGFETFFDAVVAQIRAENPDNPARVGQIIGQVAASYDVQVMPEKTPEEALPLLPR